MNCPVTLFSDSHQASPDRFETELRVCLSEESSFYQAGQEDLLHTDALQYNFNLWGNIDRFISFALPLTKRNFRADLEARSKNLLQNSKNKTSEMQSTLWSCLGIRLGEPNRTVFNERSIRMRSTLKRFLCSFGFLPFYPNLYQLKPDNIQITSEFQRSINCEQSNLRSRSSFELSLSSWKDRSHNMRTRLFRRRSRIYASFGQL